MAERGQVRAQQAGDDLRKIVGFSAADEIEKLDRLKSAGRFPNPNTLGSGRVCSAADRPIKVQQAQGALDSIWRFQKGASFLLLLNG